MGFFRNFLGITSYGAAAFGGLVTFAILFTEQQWSEKSIAFIFSLAITAGLGSLGKWLMNNKKVEIEPETSKALEQLQATFYRIVKVNNGYVTVMRLAAETGLPGKTAQLYLDAQAKEFNASYEVNEKGDIVYRFPI
ncbi:MAG: hypothetical protein WBB28_23285 [Crinalium sp.]